MVVVGGWGGVVPLVLALLVSCLSLSLPHGGGGFSKGCKRKKRKRAGTHLACRHCLPRRPYVSSPHGHHHHYVDGGGGGGCSCD